MKKFIEVALVLAILLIDGLRSSGTDPTHISDR